MKRFALTTAIALGLAAPAMAASQLEKSLGVGPGVAMSSRGVATGAAAQLAAGLGVAPGRHGLDELVAKHSAASDQGDGAWRIAN